MSLRPTSLPKERTRYSYSTIDTLCPTTGSVSTMSADPRAALSQLVAAFERHLEASSTRHGDDDPSVVAAYEDLADAFEAYDGALYDAYGEMTPLDIYTGDDEGPEDDEAVDADVLDDHDDDADGAGLYAGLDDDLDFDDDADESDSDPAGDSSPDSPSDDVAAPGRNAPGSR